MAREDEKSRAGEDDDNNYYEEEVTELHNDDYYFYNDYNIEDNVDEEEDIFVELELNFLLILDRVLPPLKEKHQSVKVLPQLDKQEELIPFLDDTDPKDRSATQ